MGRTTGLIDVDRPNPNPQGDESGTTPHAVLPKPFDSTVGATTDGIGGNVTEDSG